MVERFQMNRLSKNLLAQGISLAIVITACGSGLSADSSNADLIESLSPCDDADDLSGPQALLGRVTEWLIVDEIESSDFIAGRTSDIDVVVRPGHDPRPETATKRTVRMHQDSQESIEWGLSEGVPVNLGVNESNDVYATLLEVSDGRGVFTGECATRMISPLLEQNLGDAYQTVGRDLPKLTGDGIQEYAFGS